MKKYFLIAKNTWDEIIAYRVNFLVWRSRSILHLVTIYFLWFAIIPNNSNFLHYSQQRILTYILGTSLLSTIVFSSRVWQVGDDINNGNLSNYLLKPMNYFSFWFAKNIGDKAVNILFSVIEITILIFFLKPNLFWQTNVLFIIFFVISIIEAIFIHFLFDFILGFIAFWNPEVWGPRFIFYAIFPFIAGNFFPLDILPKPFFLFFQILPFSYLIYFPLKIYLGQVSFFQMFFGISISLLWFFILFYIAKYMWRKEYYHILQREDNMMRYIKIWWLQILLATQRTFTSRFGATLFIVGKFLRFTLFLLFLFVLGANRKEIAGYSLWQMLLFFLTFNLVDTSAQLILREVYNFRGYIVSGQFDYFLVKPYSPLIRSLFGGSDILDFPLFIILICCLFIIIPHLGVISPGGIFIYILLVINGFFIALSFHIFVLSFGILTREVDNAIFLYRDLTQMGRVPIDIYKEPLRGILTFIVPVGIMMTFPAKALMGLLSTQSILIAIAGSSLLFFFSLQAWKFALKQYSSASS